MKYLIYAVAVITFLSGSLIVAGAQDKTAKETPAAEVTAPATAQKEAPTAAITITPETDETVPVAVPESAPASAPIAGTDASEYVVGVDDILDINILKPEILPNIVTVSPNGAINFPYIGNVTVKGMTLTQVQNEIQKRLSDGYMKFPVVSVSLRESRSKKFFVYGEVMKPGTYLLDDNTSALKAISMAGGFTKFGSSSRVKVLREKKDGSGYETHKINVGAIMGGNPKTDTKIEPGDIVVVSEGLF